MNLVKKFFFSTDVFICLLIMSVSALHLLALTNPYYFDDQIVIFNNSWVKNGPAPTFWFKTFFIDQAELFPGFRPVLMMSYWLDSHLFHHQVWGFRLTNILLHSANGLWIYFIVRELLKKRILALAIALVFLLHPMQTIAINFLWKRSSALECFFSLALFYSHISWQQGKWPLRRYFAAILLLFPLGLLSKETALFVPVFLFLYDISANKKTHKELCWAYSVFGVLASFFYYFRFIVIPRWMASNRNFISDHHSLAPKEYFLSSAQFLLEYLKSIIAPQVTIIFDPSPTTAMDPLNFAALFCLAALIIGLAIYFRKTFPLVTWGLCCLTIQAAAASALPLFFFADPIRLYLPLFFIALSGGVLAHHALRNSPRIFFAAFTALTAAYAAHTLWLHHRFKTPALVWKDTVAEFPQSDLSWAEYGVALQNQELHGEAAVAFASAYKISPGKPAYLVHMLQNAAHTQETIPNLDEILKNIPAANMPVIEIINMANFTRQRGLTELSFQLSELALSKNRKIPAAYLNLGLLHLEKGSREIQKASTAFKTAYDLDPSLPIIQKGGLYILRELEYLVAPAGS